MSPSTWLYVSGVIIAALGIVRMWIKGLTELSGFLISGGIGVVGVSAMLEGLEITHAVTAVLCFAWALFVIFVTAVYQRREMRKAERGEQQKEAGNARKGF